VEELAADAAELEGAESGEPQAKSPAIGRSLYQRVQRLSARLRHAYSAGGIDKVIFVRAIDGRPAGSCEKSPDGRLVWLDPPVGCKAGEPVAAEGSARSGSGRVRAFENSKRPG
jgi:hypothetical protein